MVANERLHQTNAGLDPLLIAKEVLVGHGRLPSAHADQTEYRWRP